jgi:IclR family pca regulon transcriptional regulator
MAQQHGADGPRDVADAKGGERGDSGRGRVDMIAYTHLTLLDKEQLFRELVAVRENGFGVTENQYEIGLRGISVPVKGRRGALGASMMISSNSKAEATAKCVPALQTTANTLMLWV